MLEKFAYSPRAILYGVAANIGASILGSNVLVAVFLRRHPGEVAGPEGLREFLLADPTFLAASFALGLFCTGLGGYVAARLAPYSKLANAACTGLVDAGLGILLGGGVPAWLRAAGLLVAVPAAIYGGWLGKFRKGKGKD